MNGWVICVSLCALLAVSLAKKDEITKSDLKSQRCNMCGDCRAFGADEATITTLTDHMLVGLEALNSDWSLAAFSGRTMTSGGGGGTPPPPPTTVAPTDPPTTPAPARERRRVPGGGPMIMRSCHPTVSEGRDKRKIEKSKEKGEKATRPDGEEITEPEVDITDGMERPNTVCMTANISFHLTSDRRDRAFCIIDYPARALYTKLDSQTPEQFKDYITAQINLLEPAVNTALSGAANVADFTLDEASVVFGTKEELKRKPRKALRTRTKLTTIPYHEDLTDNSTVKYAEAETIVNNCLKEVEKDPRIKITYLIGFFQVESTASGRMRREVGDVEAETYTETDEDYGFADTDEFNAFFADAIDASGSGGLLGAPSTEIVSGATPFFVSAILMLACAIFAYV